MVTERSLKRLLCGSLLLGAPLLAGACVSEPSAGLAAHRPAADLIVRNARIYTVDEAQPWAQAVAIDDGIIVAVGNAEDMRGLIGADTRIVDLGGRLMLPAFGDAHVHPLFGGIAHSRCPLNGGKSIADYQAIIRECVRSTPGDGAIYGVGWQDALFPPKGVPDKGLLDAVTTDRPLIFESVGGHSYWVNSKALQLAGIDANTPDPENGEINRDKDGNPSGGLQERATGLVEHLIPKPTPAEIEQAIVYTARHFNGLGITNWHDAGIDLDAAGRSGMLDAYAAVKNRGELTTHVALAFKWDNDRSLEQIPVIADAARRASAAGLNAKTVKFYVDGVIPQRTAAMIAPYSGSDERGPLQIDPDVLDKAVIRLGAMGFQPYVHAIGDRAVRVGLDAFAAAIAANGSIDRPMITHLNVVDPADQKRFGELGAIAQFQPTWASNYPYMDLTKQAIGPERSQYIYPVESIRRAGGMIAFGADWPVATADPLWGLQVAVTRINYEEPGTAPLLPEEAMTLAEAIRAHTLHAAIANGNDATTGSIKVGKSADLIVLDKDIFTLPKERIGEADVLVTLFRGRPVYGNMATLGAP